MGDIRAEAADEDCGFWDAVGFLGGYCVFSFICAAIATVWLVRLGHPILSFCAINVAVNNALLRWYAHRGLGGKIRDGRNRPVVVLTAMTALGWLLLAAVLWWGGW